MIIDDGCKCNKKMNRLDDTIVKGIKCALYECPDCGLNIYIIAELVYLEDRR